MSLTIVTHNGRFHTDEVFATALLRLIFDVAEIKRTRNTDVLEDARNSSNTIIIDVGKIYDPSTCSFDHHQKSFNQKFDRNISDLINMSSCGLIWKHYGMNILCTFCDDPVICDQLYTEVYEKLFLSIDANDTGVRRLKNLDTVQYNFFYETTLGEIVGIHNTPNVSDDAKQYDAFMEAVNFCDHFFRKKIGNMIHGKKVYLKYKDKFEEYFYTAKVDGREYLYIEDEKVYYGHYINKYDPDKIIKFFITRILNGDGTVREYKIHTRRVRADSFDVVAPIISEEKAKSLVGRDLIFVHRAQFVGSCKSFEAARMVVEKSLIGTAGDRFFMTMLIVFGSLLGIVASIYYR